MQVPMKRRRRSPPLRHNVSRMLGLVNEAGEYATSIVSIKAVQAQCVLGLESGHKTSLGLHRDVVESDVAHNGQDLHYETN
jgi:hypothetical protein